MVASNIFSFHPDPSGTGIQFVFVCRIGEKTTNEIQFPVHCTPSWNSLGFSTSIFARIPGCQARFSKKKCKKPYKWSLSRSGTFFLMFCFNPKWYPWRRLPFNEKISWRIMLVFPFQSSWYSRPSYQAIECIPSARWYAANSATWQCLRESGGEERHNVPWNKELEERWTGSSGWVGMWWWKLWLEKGEVKKEKVWSSNRDRWQVSRRRGFVVWLRMHHVELRFKILGQRSYAYVWQVPAWMNTAKAGHRKGSDWKTVDYWRHGHGF